MMWVGHLACMREQETHKILVRKPKRNWPHGRTRHVWENNINVDLREIGYEEMEWIQLAQAFSNPVMNFQVPW